MARPRLFGPPRWLREGETPDYRFSLSNERTFLAWIRTALALLAGSVAIVQLVPDFGVTGVRTALGVILSASGLALGALSYGRWAGNERAMRLRAELPFTRLIAVLAGVVVVVGVLVLVLVLVDAW